MAGKLHKDLERVVIGGGQAIAPQERHGRAYAEGYECRRKGGVQTDNPYGYPLVEPEQDDAQRAWDQGWRDGDAGYPSTHVGGPDAAEPPDPEPEE